MKITLHLTEKELAEAISKTYSEKRFHDRILFIQMRYFGYSVEDAAKITGFSRATGYNLQKLWNDGGLSALRLKSGPGRPSRLTNEQKKQIKKILIETPMETKNVRILIKEEYKIDYSIKQTHVILASMGFRHVFSDNDSRIGRFKKKILWCGCHWIEL